MPTGILVPNDEPDFVAFAERAESLGYDSLWCGELWERDAFVSLARAAEHTDAIELGTAIANVYSRTPAALAQAAGTLAEAAEGRVRLGLGTSTRKAIEDLHAMDFENPPRRLHETTELARKFLQGSGRVSYEGELFEVADFPALGVDVPVYAAALGPATRRATGRTAEGWLPHNVPFGDLPAAFETISEAARERDRDPDSIEVAPYVPSAVSEDASRARATLRGHLAYYVGSGEGYRKAVAQRFPEGAEAVAEAWRGGDREAAREAVTDEMIAALGVAGTPSEAREQFEAIASMDVIDEPLVVVPTGAPEDVRERTVEELSPERR
jgi:alkanesulfonate monooxygenase SsuD/methylene tetrahydromethanopterin reductase-like flavin-dependent oxidoreductase (luciferase family)